MSGAPARLTAVYGAPPAALAPVAPASLQLSPFAIGSTPIDALADASVESLVILAPAGAVERRWVLAHGLRALAANGSLHALALKDRGGARLANELKAFGCAPVNASAKAHFRLCRTRRPAEPARLAAAIAEGALQRHSRLGLWTQPGIFAWDRIDPGSALLLAQPWRPKGRGVDMGCGLGVLGQALLASPAIDCLLLVDLDRRALEAAKRNVADRRASFLQHDLRQAVAGLIDIDFAIMNPPFHDRGAEDRPLGRQFVTSAAAMLRKGGVLRLVANVALAYERPLGEAFADVRMLACEGGYKVLEAVR